MVSIETSVTELKRTSFVVGHRLFNNGGLAIEAREVRVWASIDPDHPEHQIPADPAGGRRLSLSR